MKALPLFPIRVFYDGSCSVCSSEIEHYLRKDQNGKLLSIDISTPNFDPIPYGIPLKTFMYELHVIDQRGEVYRGIEAFWAIWQAFPTSTVYGAMGALISMSLFKPFARLLYKGFATIRPYLPKNRKCDSGACSIGSKR